MNPGRAGTSRSYSVLFFQHSVYRGAQCVLVVKWEIGMVVVGYFALAGRGPVGLGHHCSSVQALVYSRHSISACSVSK